MQESRSGRSRNRQEDLYSSQTCGLKILVSIPLLYAVKVGNEHYSIPRCDKRPSDLMQRSSYKLNFNKI